MDDLTLGLDLIAALLTLLYMAKLILVGDSSLSFDAEEARTDKRSLVEQRVYRRQIPQRA